MARSALATVMRTSSGVPLNALMASCMILAASCCKVSMADNRNSTITLLFKILRQIQSVKEWFGLTGHNWGASHTWKCDSKSDWIQFQPNRHKILVISSRSTPVMTVKCGVHQCEIKVISYGQWHYSFLHVMWLSKMSWNSQILILRYSQLKGKMSFVFYCFVKPSTAYICGSNHPVFKWFSAKCGIKNA